MPSLPEFDRDSLFSIIAGPLVWAVHFLVLYVTAAVACAKGFFGVEVLGLGVVQTVAAAATLGAVAFIVHGARMSWRRWRTGPSSPPPPHDRSDPDSRRRFIAYSGLLLCGLALIATVWQALPVLFFHSCR
ncbi:MAG TPA: hypothetical protein VFG47_12100 [Geminicoccaceae bacterium]|nr:hypothetical protein [Geminicoccaceae bacterium]